MPLPWTCGSLHIFDMQEPSRPVTTVRRDLLPVERSGRIVVFRDGDGCRAARLGDSFYICNMSFAEGGANICFPLGNCANSGSAVHGIPPFGMGRDRVVPVLGIAHRAVTGITILRQHVADVVCAVVARCGRPVRARVVILEAVGREALVDTRRERSAAAECCCSCYCGARCDCHAADGRRRDKCHEGGTETVSPCCRCFQGTALL